MSYIRCVALSDGGFVAVRESGTCVYDGINSTLAAVLEEQKGGRIEYVAAGCAGQYYIRMANGKILCNGPDEFRQALSSTYSPVHLIAFGDGDTFFVMFADGRSVCSSGLENVLDGKAHQLLRSAALQTVWLGSGPHIAHAPHGDAASIGYYIGYNRGECVHRHLPSGVEEWLSRKSKCVQVKQVLADERDNFFIRFS
jgi:hypothetical protein